MNSQLNASARKWRTERRCSERSHDVLLELRPSEERLPPPRQRGRGAGRAPPTPLSPGSGTLAPMAEPPEPTRVPDQGPLSGPGPGAPRHRRAHTPARDLERYSKLFAKRTRVMRSSAMRDLMEITARPEVISLAGGLPDTSTFPPQSFAAQMTRIAQESSAQALQYGPTEGFARTKHVIRDVMRAEGMEPDLDDILVTTGGQQAIDLVVKALIDPGDIVIAEAPTYPGAVPTFTAYEAETI